MSQPPRKQVHALTLTDLDRVPAWEFALDEEGAATGQVGFWMGRRAPSRAEIDACCARLGKATASEVFPVRFAADVPVVNGPVVGAIEGFMVLDDLRSRRTRVLR